MLRSLPQIALLLALGPAVSACSLRVLPAESVTALSEPCQAAYDQRLIGAWHLAESDGFLLQIFPGRDPCGLDVIGFWFVEPTVRWLRATAYASAIGGRVYYNVQRVSGAGLDFTAADAKPGFIIARAIIAEDGELLLYLLGLDTERGFLDFADPDKGHYVFDKLIEIGRLRGRQVAAQGLDSPYYILDATPNELASLFRDTPEELLFQKIGPLRRIAGHPTAGAPDP